MPDPNTTSPPPLLDQSGIPILVGDVVYLRARVEEFVEWHRLTDVVVRAVDRDGKQLPGSAYHILPQHICRPGTSGAVPKSQTQCSAPTSNPPSAP